MSEFFHQASGEWNEPQNQTTYTEVAKEPAKEQVRGVDNVNMFGAAATTPSAENQGHGQLHFPQEPVGTGADDQLLRPGEHAPNSKSSEYEGKPAIPKKANPFV